MRLALALTSAQADRLGIAPAVLARATLEDLCDLPDADFRAAMEIFLKVHGLRRSPSRDLFGCAWHKSRVRLR